MSHLEKEVCYKMIHPSTKLTRSPRTIVPQVSIM